MYKIEKPSLFKEVNKVVNLQVENLNKDSNFFQLNPFQLEAVKSSEGPYLILAGPGTGKTTVITYRTLFLLENQKAKPEELLILTFTNKAAEEMQKRIKRATNSLLPYLGTFHSVIVKLLKEILPIKTSIFKLENKINIIDEEDKIEIIKNILNQKRDQQKQIKPYTLSNIISSLKNKKFLQIKEETSQLIEEYNNFLKKIQSLDFDDIILCINNVFTEKPKIKEKISSKFKYIIVDEFQDINLTQFEFLLHLTEKNKNIFVVGDDDQSIYSFRNACVKIMLDFPKFYPNTKIINLQYNYRSPTNIIKNYLKLISYNTLRYPKTIEAITPREGKFEIKIFKTLENEYYYISSIINKIDLKNKSVVILTRTNDIAKEFEKNLIKNGVNAKFIGGYDFFERKEIRDIISFLKIINNPKDDFNFLRVLKNFFKLTKRQLDKITKKSDEKNIINILYYENFEIFKIIDNFINKINQNEGKINVNILFDIIEIYPYQNNIVDSFIRFTEKFLENHQDARLEDFLNYIALIKASREQRIEEKGKVLIMTMHASKGLEFDIVFVSRVNQGVIPHYKVDEEEKEEERRLLYVAMSRAKEELYITATTPPSEFLIPFI